MNVWRIILNPFPPGGPYNIEVESISGNELTTASLVDVYFGDVWVCGGQSNMQFTVGQVLSIDCIFYLVPGIYKFNYIFPLVQRGLFQEETKFFFPDIKSFKV